MHLRRSLLLLGAAGATLGLAAPAQASGGWQAEFVSKSADVDLESGQETISSVRAKNTGANTWSPSGPNSVRLGTAEPRDRESALYLPEDWFASHRPSLLDEASVASGGIGNFTFKVRAPKVSEVTRFAEWFEPVAEGASWLGDTGGDPPRSGNWPQRIVYRVTPPVPPTAFFTIAPTRVRRGDPIFVSGQVRDDYKVAKVEFATGSQVAEGQAADDVYSGALPSDQLGLGPQTLFLKATDHVGNVTTLTHSFEVYDAAPVVVPPSITPKLDVNVALRARLIRRNGKRRLKVLRLTVTAPVGSRLAISCRPRRCKSQVLGSTIRTVTRPGRTRGRIFKRGNRIYVRVTKPGHIGTLTRFTVGKRTVAKNEFAIPAQ